MSKIEYEEVELDLPDWAISRLAVEAHKQDITLNEYINNILRKYMEEESEKENLDKD